MTRDDWTDRDRHDTETEAWMERMRLTRDRWTVAPADVTIPSPKPTLREDRLVR